MAERTKPEKFSEEEINEYGNFSPEDIARIINTSLFRKPGDAGSLGTLIEGIYHDEEFVLLLMKTINPGNPAFFENVIGICETRIKEKAEQSSSNQWIEKNENQ